MNKLATVAFLAGLSFQAQAVTVSWTDWTAIDIGGGTASGVMNVGGFNINIDISSSSQLSGASHIGGASHLWDTGAYTNGSVTNAPTGAQDDHISLNAGGTVTINFSETVGHVYVAMASWENQVVDFGQQISVVSSGPGYYGGTGAYSIINGGTTLSTGGNPNGNWHGIVRVDGLSNSLSFTHNTENWHGFTLGVVSVSEVPATMGLFGGALLLMGAAARRRSGK